MKLCKTINCETLQSIAKHCKTIFVYAIQKHFQEVGRNKKSTIKKEKEKGCKKCKEKRAFGYWQMQLLAQNLKSL